MESLKCAFLNIRSLVSHFFEFRDTLISNNFTICGVSETRLDNTIPTENLSIKGYDFVRCDRNRQGGGVGVYLRSDLDYVVLQSSKNIEQIWLKICVNNVTMIFSIVYRPPDISRNFFFDEFGNTLSLLLPTADYVFCLGDFNINLLNYESTDAKYVVQILEGMGMKQLLNQPTRITPTTATLIDYVLSSDEDIITETGVLSLTPGVTDHELIFCVINVKTQKSKPVYVTSRDFKHLNYDQFYADLRSIPWNNIYFLNTVDEKVQFLNENIIALLDLHAPFKTYKITKKYAPWLTDTLRAMMADRDKARNRFKISKSNADWNHYKILRNNVSLAVDREKSAYYNYKLNVHNSALIWPTLKSLNLNSERYRKLPTNLSNVENINTHFINSISTVPADDSTISFYTNNIKESVTSILKFTPVTEAEVLKILSNIKSKATGHDGINIYTIHLCLPHILPHITHLFNYCIINSVFPEIWSKALVIPVPKVSNPIDYNNIRPISILPVLSKGLEKILESQLKNHVYENSIIPHTQSGFKQGHSCTTSLLNITDDILRATDQGKLTALILLDYTKAFDTLNHKMLIAILHYIGLSFAGVSLLYNYLKRRSQAVVYEGKQSSFLNLTVGVPQGSILGPTLFSIYISNFFYAAISCFQHYYADDTQLILSFYPDEKTQAMDAINFDLSEIYDISKNHCLQLNSNKSNVIIFGRKKDRNKLTADNLFKILINGQQLRKCEHVKNLGLIMDQDLRFSSHISKCLQKAYLNLRFVYQNRMYFNRNIKKILCESLVLAQLNYCDVVYGSCLNSIDKKRIQKLQNSCLRLIFGIRKYEHISHTFKTIKWLNMQNRRYLHSACLYFTVINYKCPTYLYRKISYRCDVHNLNLRSRGGLTPPKRSTEQFKRSFTFNVTNCFNNLSQDIKVIKHRNTFKNQLQKKIIK